MVSLKNKRINYVFIISLFLICLSVFLILSVYWIVDYFNNPTVNQIIYHLLTPLEGTDLSIIFDFGKKCIVPIIVLVIIYIFVKIIAKKSLKKELVFSKKCNRYFLIFSLTCFFGSVYFSLDYLGLIDYYKDLKTDSLFIENNYVNPSKVNLDFPKKKRNLIVLYLESMESSFSSVSEGGAYKYNLIPNLTAFGEDYVNFSATDKLGGPYQVSGTGWTTAGFVSTMAGIPIKSPFIGDEINDHPFNYSKVSMISDILADNGYYEKLVMGSTSHFGGIDLLFENHGNFDIYDLDRFSSEDLITEDSRSDWGLKDSFLFDYVKNDLSELSHKKEPFYYVINTIDTHTPGFVDSTCDSKYKDNYEKTINCSDDIIYEFIKSLQKQDFYKNTTIVLLGDHLTMNNDIDFGDYKRYSYNVFINSNIKASNIKNRNFSQFDLFPSMLASIGVKIEGNKLGLGVNLFSDEKTLIEEYGLDYVNNELDKNSIYYITNLLY